jgi:hypothetical protein
MSLDLKSFLRQLLTKNLILDLEDRLKAEAVKAFEMIRDRSGLSKKRARELEGQARFRMMEEGFEAVCQLHGGALLNGGVLPTTELKVFQPFMRFERDGKGLILGLAAMAEPRKVPNKNLSRAAAVSLNYHLSPRFAFDDKGPKLGDIFVMFLVARDRERAGKVEEIAVGVVDSGYSAFLFYEPLDQFLAGVEDGSGHVPPAGEKPAPNVRLKPVPTPFTPPEAPPKKDDDTGAA